MIYISPSQLATFKDCRRKWAYRYIDGIKTPPKKEQQFGLEGHSRTEGWLKKGTHVGDDDVGKTCAQGIKPGYLPTPASDLLIEHKLEIPILDGRARMIGYIDCVLPPRKAGNILTTPVVHDWKFTKDLRWAMSPGELYKDAQAAVYAYWALHRYESAKVVVRWVYFCGRINAKSEDGRPRTPRGVKKVELTLTAKEIEEHWAREIEVARQVAHTKATYQTASEVPPDETACDKYGGCDHRERCPLAQEGDFSLGAMMENWDRTHNTTKDTTMTKKAEHELLTKLREHKANMLAQQAANPPTPPVEEPPKPTPPVEEPPAPAGLELLAKLQAQSGATSVNPPEANVVVPKTEASPTIPEPPPTQTEPPSPTTEQPPATTEVTAADLELLTSGNTEAARALVNHTHPLPPPVEEPAKKKRGRPAKNTAKATKAPFILAIDTVASKLQNGALGEVVQLSEFVEPFTKAIAKGHRCDIHPQGVDHWNLIEFANGGSILAHQVANHLDQKGFGGVLVMDSLTAEGRALTEVLIKRADAVFRGVR